MRLRQHRIQLIWRRPSEDITSLVFFRADTHIVKLPGYEGGLVLAEDRTLSTRHTVFILPEWTVLRPHEPLTTLFTALEVGRTVQMLDKDTMVAWAYADGGVEHHGLATVQDWGVGRVGNEFYSDTPKPVLVLSVLRFFSEDEIRDLISHLDTRPAEERVPVFYV